MFFTALRLHNQLIAGEQAGSPLEVVCRLVAKWAPVIDGQVVGMWKRTVKKSAVAVELHPFEALSDAEQGAVDKAIEGYGQFLELPVVK